MAIAAMVAWVLTASIGVYMLRTWVVRGGLRRQRATGVGVPPAVVFGHAGTALTGLPIWLAFIRTGWVLLGWLGVTLIVGAIALGVSTVTLWTPYPVAVPPAAVPPAAVPPAPVAETPAAPDAFTVTDEMIAELMADSSPAARLPRFELAGLVPVAHGFAALTTFMLAVLAAVSARLGSFRPVRQSGIMAETLTMMAVHAHPDDEASSTGGVLASYSAQGVRTVVVTCTNGEFGDAPGGVKPGQNGHDEREVARQRLAELRESCAILGVTNLELLGYHDSGMPEWDYKDRPDAFCNVPEADVAARISGLIDRYRPQVLITYDDQAAYQHPDHVHASRSAQKAFAASGSVAKLYLTAMRGSDWRKIWEVLRELGAEVPDFENVDPERQRRALESEQRITTTVDIRSVLSRKREALFAHGSQIGGESWFSKIPPDIAEATFGRESFIRVSDTTGAPLPEDDLFAGLRP
jgi:LmbE family N-acetylglucosaminyl deacetylase